MSEEPGYVDKHIHQSFRDLTLAGSYCKLLVRNISFPSLKAPRLLRDENKSAKVTSRLNISSDCAAMGLDAKNKNQPLLKQKIYI